MKYIVRVRTSINGVRVHPGQTVIVTPDDHVNSLLQSGAIEVEPEILTQQHEDTHREVDVVTKSPRGRGGRPPKQKL